MFVNKSLGDSRGPLGFCSGLKTRASERLHIFGLWGLFSLQKDFLEDSLLGPVPCCRQGCVCGGQDAPRAVLSRMRGHPSQAPQEPSFVPSPQLHVMADSSHRSEFPGHFLKLETRESPSQENTPCQSRPEPEGVETQGRVMACPPGAVPGLGEAQTRRKACLPGVLGHQEAEGPLPRAEQHQPTALPACFRGTGLPPPEAAALLTECPGNCESPETPSPQGQRFLEVWVRKVYI